MQKLPCPAKSGPGPFEALCKGALNTEMAKSGQIWTRAPQPLEKGQGLRFPCAALRSRSFSPLLGFRVQGLLLVRVQN